jgi:glutamate formiminotransferase/glutamate formiminotransferase/formiminotetrahydrofolate cyclodeaminase
MSAPLLITVPNASEGRNAATIRALAGAFADDVARESGVRLLDVHADADHQRSVFTAAGPATALVDAVMVAAGIAVERIDVVGAGESEAGQHPHVGALDVAPLVYLDHASRGAACAHALVLADRIGQELQVPVFLYGELTAAAGRPARTRAELRRGGLEGLRARMEDRGPEAGGALRPDYGPPDLHNSAGATLVAARPPLVAFNLQLAAPAGLDQARRIAAEVRESGDHGLPGVRAIGVLLSGGVAQVSMNVERPLEVSLAEVVEAVGAHAPVASAELVGLAPAAAMDGFPQDLPMPGFDPARHLIENALGS